ncbi:carbon catabolite repressor protein 4 homolog 5-like isoform X2 [Wolffia australiana]
MVAEDRSSLAGLRHGERSGAQSNSSPCRRRSSNSNQNKRRSNIDTSTSHRCPRRRKIDETRCREHRPWVSSPSSQELSCQGRFVMVSYNILGVENASKHPDLYHLVDPENLRWDRRKRRIRRELRRYDPDILCFQEVDHFEDLADLLHKDGYVGVYQARTGDANDGCAIFWRDKQFSLLHEENIQYREFGLRDNVAQLCVFKVLDAHPGNRPSTEKTSQPDRKLLVGNVHILFNPNRGDVKLGQMRLLLEKAHKVSRKWKITSMVIGGDFNSLPQSALYRFIANSMLDYLKHDRRAISGQISDSHHQRSFILQTRCGWTEEERLLATGRRDLDLLVHPLRLRSAYAGIPGDGGRRDWLGEPQLTSFHGKFMGTVDYIWHSAGLEPVRVVEMPAIRAVRGLGGLPSKKWGSDHFSLVCEFAFTAEDDNGDDVFHGTDVSCQMQQTFVR